MKLNVLLRGDRTIPDWKAENSGGTNNSTPASKRGPTMTSDGEEGSHKATSGATRVSGSGSHSSSFAEEPVVPSSVPSSSNVPETIIVQKGKRSARPRSDSTGSRASGPPPLVHESSTTSTTSKLAGTGVYFKSSELYSSIHPLQDCSRKSNELHKMAKLPMGVPLPRPPKLLMMSQVRALHQGQRAGSCRTSPSSSRTPTLIKPINSTRSTTSCKRSNAGLMMLAPPPALLTTNSSKRIKIVHDEDKGSGSHPPTAASTANENLSQDQRIFLEGVVALCGSKCPQQQQGPTTTATNSSKTSSFLPPPPFALNHNKRC